MWLRVVRSDEGPASLTRLHGTSCQEIAMLVRPREQSESCRIRNWGAECRDRGHKAGDKDTEDVEDRDRPEHNNLACTFCRRSYKWHTNIHVQVFIVMS
jgi:hypothetical protein